MDPFKQILTLNDTEYNSMFVHQYISALVSKCLDQHYVMFLTGVREFN